MKNQILDRGSKRSMLMLQASRYFRYPESFGPPFCLNQHGGYILAFSDENLCLINLVASVFVYLLCPHLMSIHNVVILNIHSRWILKHDLTWIMVKIEFDLVKRTRQQRLGEVANARLKNDQLFGHFSILNIFCF